MMRNRRGKNLNIFCSKYGGWDDDDDLYQSFFHFMDTLIKMTDITRFAI